MKPSTYAQKLNEAIADRRKLMDAADVIGGDTLHTFEAKQIRPGLPLRTIQWAAAKGYLKVERLSPRIILTTRAWVYEWAEGEYKRRKATGKI